VLPSEVVKALYVKTTNLTFVEIYSI
jgi:hypothetical protein